MAINARNKRYFLQTGIGAGVTAAALLLAAPAGIALAGPTGCGSGGAPNPGGGPPPPPGCGSGNPSTTISGAVSAFQTQLKTAVTDLQAATNRQQTQAAVTEIHTANTTFRNSITSIVTHH